MGHHNEYNILCAYCDADADVMVLYDNGTRYYCFEHHKNVDGYWPYEILNQRDQKLACGVFMDEDKSPELHIKKPTGEKKPFYAPVLVNQKTAKKLLDLIEWKWLPDSNPVAPLKEQLEQALEYTSHLDSVNGIDS